MSLGGKCQECGYNKNIAALEFHHINPDEKEFQLDMRHLSNTSIEKLRIEAAKCKLLCANCHRELHNPEFYFDNLNSLLETYKDMEDKPLDKSTKSIAICPICGKYFLCVSKGYKNDLPRSLRSTPFKSPDRALIVCSLYKLFDNKRYKSKLKIK